MGKQETNISQLCRIEACKHDARIFRNNRGLFLTLDGKRKVRAGLEVGGSCDLIGFKTVTITQEMVGQKIAIFTGVEIKIPGEYPSSDQKKFIAGIRAAGGIAGVATCPEDVAEILNTRNKHLLI